MSNDKSEAIVQVREQVRDVDLPGTLVGGLRTGPKVHLQKL